MWHSVCKSRDTQRSACLALHNLQFHSALLNECWLLIHDMSGMPSLENSREQWRAEGMLIKRMRKGEQN